MRACGLSARRLKMNMRVRMKYVKDSVLKEEIKHVDSFKSAMKELELINIDGVVVVDIGIFYTL